MMALHIASLFYLSFYLCFVLGLIDVDEQGGGFWRALVRRWGKLLGGLLAIGVVVQVLTWISGG